MMAWQAMAWKHDVTFARDMAVHGEDVGYRQIQIRQYPNTYSGPHIGMRCDNFRQSMIDDLLTLPPPRPPLFRAPGGVRDFIFPFPPGTMSGAGPPYALIAEATQKLLGMTDPVVSAGPCTDIAFNPSIIACVACRRR